MIGMAYVRVMEMTSTSKVDDSKEVCPKCGREGCTCGPECDCGKDTSVPQKDLIQDFE
jgi:hypothetical protein